MTDQDTTVEQVVKLVAGTNAELIIQDPVKTSLVRDLQPVAESMVHYASYAENVVVENQQQADEARAMEKRIQMDVKAVKGNEVLSGIIKGLHGLHKKWKAVENRFIPEMEESRKAIRTARIAWEEAEREKAEAEQRRLQEIENERARKARAHQEKLEQAQREKEEAARREEEALRRQAAEAKNDEERKKLEAEAEHKRKLAEKAAREVELRQEKAKAVPVPLVHIEAPKAKGGSRQVWEATIVSTDAFFAALAAQPQLAGFVEIKLNALIGAKRSNPLFDVDGIEFKQVLK